ncbi:MAG: glutamine synthetase III [Erysipelotrichaceae bacterium]|jgi:glutamine synthetase|nr:glutamine synthetase III [Erysipelotrichaceae bacterium]
MTKHVFDDFGKYLFNDAEMKKRLPRNIYVKWVNSLKHEGQLSQNTADAIAHAMKDWALSLGATHYSHWFQPLTGATAQKHESFLEPDANFEPLTRFSGKMLIRGNADGSSFPTGGLRATFEARGYTYWDITSPAFVRDNILYIPTVFVSYNYDSLDLKAPLLKSIETLSAQSVKVLHLLGQTDVTTVTPVLGTEQEYFLIKKEYYKNREDLVLTGRTLIGAAPAKGQESEEHYFSSIPNKVEAFMKDLNEECWKVGIFNKTEHREVGYGQFECVPVYAPIQIAIDQNQLTMELLRKVADKHGMAALLHEKPFARINGSGKHNNWSLMTDTGINLTDPNDSPEQNYSFLVFVASIIRAIDQYPELLRLTASGPSNDFRLGANEAPPAIISMYLGDTVGNLLDDIANDRITSTDAGKLFSPLDTLRAMPIDVSDRNRTSPFAFTGEKFEFRMVGSSLSCAPANTVLNTILADSLAESYDFLAAKLEKEDISKAVFALCKDIMQKHGRVLFSGNGYSDEWVKEAAKRGLPNIRSFSECIDYLIDPRSIALFEKYKVFSKAELESRAEILHEQFNNSVKFEAQTLIDMLIKYVLPGAMDQLAEYAKLSALPDVKALAAKKAKVLGGLVTKIDAAIEKLSKDLDKSNKLDNGKKGAFMVSSIRPQMEDIRTLTDTMESLIARKYYPLPNYTDMMFDLDD